MRRILRLAIPFWCLYSQVKSFHAPRFNSVTRAASLRPQLRLTSSSRLRHGLLGVPGRRTTPSLMSTASLLDVALDIPLPIYPSGAVAKPIIGPLRRLVLIALAAVLIGMFRRSTALMPKLTQWIDAIKSFASPQSPVVAKASVIENKKVSFKEEVAEIKAEEVEEDFYDDAFLDDESFETMEATEDTIQMDDSTDEIEGTQMLFEDEGWGQARFASAQQLPDSTLVKISFELPRPTDYIPLAVGEKIRICGMLPDDTPLEAEFYPYGNASSGTFSILVEDPSTTDDDAKAKLLQLMLDGDGEDVAIQPAADEADAVNMERITPWELSSNDIDTIVYWANGSGIAPVMDHLQVILDNEDTEGIENANLLWVNSALADFEYAEADLEEQYERQSDRLAISCVAEDAPTASEEIDDALSEYQTGMMAVLSGPQSYTVQAAQFLMESKGYPEEAICIL